MNEWSNLYRHGYARVAACTIPSAVADPPTNADTVLGEVRACHDEGVALSLIHI